jgi:single-stranded DNA-specific DHH superfamily exonuclease
VNYIFTDDDTDGLCSARILYDYLTLRQEQTELYVQKWNIFGMTDEDIKRILSARPSHVYILDIGSDEDVLTKISILLQDGIEVSVFDNHPPDPVVLGEERLRKVKDILNTLLLIYKDKFHYTSTRDNCTTGLVYQHVRKQLPNTTPAMDKWALVGIYGDVASNTVGGSEVLGQLKSKYAYLLGAFSKSTFDWKLINFFTQLLHVPRRILYDNASTIVWHAMNELENMDWLELEVLYNSLEPHLRNVSTASSYTTEAFDSDFHQCLEVIGKAMPSLPTFTTRLLATYIIWHQRWKQALTDAPVFLFPSKEKPAFSVSLIIHPWNVGSAVANIQCSQLNVPHFCINKIAPDIIHVSGRAWTTHNLHIGQVFANCDKTILDGGGIKEAGSANGKTTNLELIMQELVQTALRFIPKSEQKSGGTS